MYARVLYRTSKADQARNTSLQRQNQHTLGEFKVTFCCSKIFTHIVQTHAVVSDSWGQVKCIPRLKHPCLSGDQFMKVTAIESAQSTVGLDRLTQAETRSRISTGFYTGIFYGGISVFLGMRGTCPAGGDRARALTRGLLDFQRKQASPLQHMALSRPLPIDIACATGLW